MKIAISAFKGTFPRLSDRLLPESAATIAEGCRLQSGEVRSFRQSPIVEALGAGTIDTIYRWSAGGTDYWLRFPGDVDVVRSPVADDVWERIYWTGDTRFTEPRMSYTPAAYTGGTDYPVVSYKLGLPPPSSQISVVASTEQTFTISAIHLERPVRVQTSVPHGLKDGELVKFRIVGASPGDGETNLENLLNPNVFQVTVTDTDELILNNSDGANGNYTAFVSGEMDQYFAPEFMDVRFYVHTYVSEIGEEGPPSEPSASAKMTPYQTATLTLPPMAVGDGEGRNITLRRIYRTATGNIGSQFQFVAEVPVAATELVDDISTQDLGESIPSTQWDPPHEEMIGLQVSAQGVGFGFFRNVLAASEPNMLHAWPTSYQQAMDYNIVAIAVIDNGVVVATDGRPYLVQGIEPRTMLPRRLEVNLACVSKRSMVSLGYAAIYASSAGLVMVDRGGARLVTDKLITAEEWRALGPETIRAYEVNSKYLAFFDGGAMLFDPRELEIGFTDVDVSAVSAFHDPREPYLYLLDEDNNIRLWDDPAAPKQPWRWRSKVFGVPRLSNMASAKVTAKIGAGEVINFRLVADGAVVHEQAVVAGEPFWLPDDVLAREFAVDLDGTGDLQMVEIAESMEELEP